MIEVGRRPVLILWGTIVAERLGFERDEALTLGRAVARLGGRTVNASAEGVKHARIAEIRAGLRLGQTADFSLLGRVVCIARVPEGLRALVNNRPIDPASVELYLGEKFGEEIDTVAAAMIGLAETLPALVLAECASDLFEQFQPEASGLDIERISALAQSDPGDGAVAGDERLGESWCEDVHAEMPSFRGPHAMRSRGEPIRHQRRAYVAPAYHPPAAITESPETKIRECAIEPSLSSAAASPVARLVRTRSIVARRPTSPFVLILAVTLAGAVGGGVGALLVAPPQHVMADLKDLLASHRQSSLPLSRTFEAEPVRSAADSDPSVGSPSGESVAVDMATSLGAATADVSRSRPANGTPAYPLLDSPGSGGTRMGRADESSEREMSPPVAMVTTVDPLARPLNAIEDLPVDSHTESEITRLERSDEARGDQRTAAEMSPPVAPAVAIVPPSSTDDAMPGHLPVEGNTVSELARIDAADEAPGTERTLDASRPVAAAVTAVSRSSTAKVTSENPSVDSQGTSEVARIAMERGDERMRQGDVVAARRFYEMAAGAGMVQAATAMGRTFDPLYLRHIRVRGALADAQRARQWYENAANAGDMEALARIELMTWNSSHR
jgi:hypothetical protein